MILPLRSLWPAALVGALLLGACFSLRPQQDPTRFYVLEVSTLPSQGTSVNMQDGLRLGLKAIKLAPHLDTPHIVTRQSTHELSFSEAQRWGEDLHQGIGRVLAEYLIATPLVSHVQVVPWSRRVNHDYVIDVRIDRFEGEQGQARLLASWTILDDSDTVLRSGNTNYAMDNWTPGDYQELVHKLSAALDLLAQDLVKELDQLAPPPAASG